MIDALMSKKIRRQEYQHKLMAEKKLLSMLITQISRK